LVTRLLRHRFPEFPPNFIRRQTSKKPIGLLAKLPIVQPCRGHAMPVVFCHMIRSGSSYAEPGGDLSDCLEPERLTRYYLKRLEWLGHKVTLETGAA
jgi:hypothetical protein